MEDRLLSIEWRLEQMASKVDLQELRAEMHKCFHDLSKWMMGTAMVMCGLIVSVVALELNIMLPKFAVSSAQAPAPVVVNVPAPAAPLASGNSAASAGLTRAPTRH